MFFERACIRMLCNYCTCVALCNNYVGWGGVFLLLHCAAWWRIIYLLCLVVSGLKGVLVN